MPNLDADAPSLRVRSFAGNVQAFREGTDTPRAFLERCIEVIEARDSEIGAFVATNFERARADADASTERWKTGQTLSLIDGMPIGIKDVFETADMPTGQGSPLFEGWCGGIDSAAVAALREAGALIIGKTLTTEFAATEPGTTRNPWDLDRTPGGSSSGSAASVGSGMVPVALGSQVVGSTLRPASYCGCFGFKPSEGGINRGGCFDVFSQSCVGFIAASLEEVWTVARAISSRAGGDPGYPGLSGLVEMPPAKKPKRVAMLETDGWVDATEDAKKCLYEALERFRADGIDVVDRTSSEDVAAAEEALSGALPLTFNILMWERRWPLNTYARDLDPSKLSQATMASKAKGEKLTLEEYQGFLDERRQVRETFSRLKDHVDACVTLAATGPAPVGLGPTTGNTIMNLPASLLGTPAVTLPVLWTEGFPLGLQVMGFNEEDAALISVSASMLALF